MLMAKEKTLQSYLKLSDHPLGAALQRAHSLQACNQQFQNLLPKRLKNKVNILNVRDGCVIIGVCNASLMTQLHFESEELLNEIKQLPGMQRSECVQFKVINDTVKLSSDATRGTNDISNVDMVNNTNTTRSIAPSDSNSAPNNSTNSDSEPASVSADASTTQQVNQGKNSARRSQITAYAGEVLRQAATQVKDPQLQSALLKISKKAH